MKLSEKMTMRSNNLSFLKFIASLLVIYSHSYAVSVLNTQGDIFYRLGGSKLSLGAFAVGVFFFFSGFYICRSVEKAKNANRFFSARIRRIFPALIFVILLTVFVLGPIVTSLNIVEYLTNKKTYLYLLNIVLIPVHKLPGVFESNVYNLAVNGSLWTLPFEFLCYFGTFIIYKMKCLNAKFLNKLFIPVLIIFLLTNYFQIPIFNYFKGHYRAVYMYYFGMLFYVNRNNIMLDKKIYIISSLLFVFFWLIGFPEVGQFIFLPYIFIYFALEMKQVPEKLANLGKYSYSIYLVGFLVQQTVTFMHGGMMNPIVNTLESILISIILSIFIYRNVETKF